MLKSKRGLEGPLWILIVAIALIIFLLIYSDIFTKLLGKEKKEVEQQIEVDKDKDNVPNIIDKCPCITGEISNEGCPYGQAPTKC